MYHHHCCGYQQLSVGSAHRCVLVSSLTEPAHDFGKAFQVAVNVRCTLCTVGSIIIIQPEGLYDSQLRPGWYTLSQVRDLSETAARRIKQSTLYNAFSSKKIMTWPFAQHVSSCIYGIVTTVLCSWRFIQQTACLIASTGYCIF